MTFDIFKANSKARNITPLYDRPNHVVIDIEPEHWAVIKTGLDNGGYYEFTLDLDGTKVRGIAIECGEPYKVIVKLGVLTN